MRIWLITIILGMSIFAHAQNKKNEIRVGVPGAYFFEKSPYRFNAVPVPTFFSFTRFLQRKIAVNIEYRYYSLSGENGTNYFGRIKKREFHQLASSINYTYYSNNSFKLSLNTGINYRFSGGELFHISYGWIEEYLGYRPYNDFGFSIGNDVKCKFYKRFSLGLEIDYTRFFTEVSHNQLSTAVFIGYEF